LSKSVRERYLGCMRNVPPPSKGNRMNKQQVKGMANQATGEVKEQVGKLTGDRSLEARGHAREMKGKAQKQMGDTREALRTDQKELFDRDRQLSDSERRDRELRRR
jgi:uncharacterized protein YjbJ (UPF0337 family)